MYKLKLSRREKKKLLRSKWLIILLAIIGICFMVWWVWVRPAQLEASIGSFEQCVQAGNPVQQSYPEVCLSKGGKRFVNLKQDQARKASLSNDAALVPPSNPALLRLDIEEWGVRIPLTNDTFDLTYAYIENGESEKVSFTYKRLLNLDACKGDIGLSLSRSVAQNQPPFSETHPAAVALVDKYYFYVTHTNDLCYDVKNAQQVAMVKKIAGEQSLIQATTALLTKLTATPKE